MSATSYWVTRGTVAQTAPRCSAVLRRTPRIGCRSITPHLVKSGSGSATTWAPACGPTAVAPAFAIITSRLAWAFTSSIEIRPSSPEPITSAMSTPSSRAMRRTDGAAGAAGPLDSGSTEIERTPREISTTFSRSWGTGRGASAGGGGGGGGAAADWAGCSTLAGGAGAAEAPSSTLRIVCPTVTLSPALTLISLTWPATEDGTSIVALSVSSSRTGCSCLIVSPTLTSTRVTSPVATFSPNSGTLNSVTEILRASC